MLGVKMALKIWSEENKQLDWILIYINWTACELLKWTIDIAARLTYRALQSSFCIGDSMSRRFAGECKIHANRTDCACWAN